MFEILYYGTGYIRNVLLQEFHVIKEVLVIQFKYQDKNNSYCKSIIKKIQMLEFLKMSGNFREYLEDVLKMFEDDLTEFLNNTVQFFENRFVINWKNLFCFQRYFY